MIIEEEIEDPAKLTYQQRVQCLDCHCIGILNQKNGKVYLFPEEVLSTRSINTKERHLKKKKTWKKKVTAKFSNSNHGFSTMSQKNTYVVLGSIFWITIMLVANVISLEKSRAVTTFLTSTCNRNYKKCVRVATMDYCGHLMKQCYATKEFILPEPFSNIEHAKDTPLVFSEEENDVNLRRCQKKQFYDQKICRHLCSETLVLEATRTNPVSPCESMCFELTRSSDSAGDVCPTQKYCPLGCPCPFYECEKTESRQKFIPVFDLEEAVSIASSTMSPPSTSTQSTKTIDWSLGSVDANNPGFLNPAIYSWKDWESKAETSSDESINSFTMTSKKSASASSTTIYEDTILWDDDGDVVELITDRWSFREINKQMFPIYFSDLSGETKNLKIEPLNSYERFVLSKYF